SDLLAEHAIPGPEIVDHLALVLLALCHPATTSVARLDRTRAVNRSFVDLAKAARTERREDVVRTEVCAALRTHCDDTRRFSSTRPRSGSATLHSVTPASASGIAGRQGTRRSSGARTSSNSSNNVLRRAAAACPH